MKKGLLKGLCLLFAVTLVSSSVFATGLGTSSKIVKVGTVDNAEVTYDVDVEWGSMIFDFNLVDGPGAEHYEWAPESQESDSVIITNKSSVMVNTDVRFASSIEDVYGCMNNQKSGTGSRAYSLLPTEPADWGTATYYQKEETSYGFYVVEAETEFEANKYYRVLGAGGGPYSNEIPGVSFVDGITEYDVATSVSNSTWCLELSGGTLSNVRPGATIGTLTVTIN